MRARAGRILLGLLAVFGSLYAMSGGPNAAGWIWDFAMLTLGLCFLAWGFTNRRGAR